MVGRVVSTKMVKSAVVLVERTKTHPLYKKSYTQTKKYLVDDQIGVKLGDVVVFEKTRPISKSKHWRITKVLGADFVSLQEAELKESAIEAIEEVLPEETEEKTVESVTSETNEATVTAKVEVIEPEAKKEKAKKPVKKAVVAKKKEKK